MLSTFFPEEGGLTWRSTFLGCIIGTLLCTSNMWFGLQTGWVTMGSLQSALLAWVLVRLSQKYNGNVRELSVSEHVMITTISTASATMPLAAGFVGIIPALRILQSKGKGGAGPLPLQSSWDQILWSLSVCFLGVFVAVPLRGYLRSLRFPSGTATASLIENLHDKTLQAPSVDKGSVVVDDVDIAETEVGKGGGASGGIASNPAERAVDPPPPPSLTLVSRSFALSAALAFASFFFPVLTGLPIFSFFGLSGLTTWSWVATLSLSYVGQGMIMGKKTCYSMFLGALVAWGLVGPLGAAVGWITLSPLSSNPRGGRGFNLWISLSILLTEAFVTAALALRGMLFSTPQRVSTTRVEESDGGTAATATAATAEAASTAVRFTAGVSLVDSVGSEAGYDTESISTTSFSTCTPASAAASVAVADDESGGEGNVDPNGNLRGGCDAAAALTPSFVAQRQLDRVERGGVTEVLPSRVWILGLCASSLLAVLVLVPIGGVGVGEAVLSVILSLPISVVAVRVLGETDLNPVSGLGKVTQVVFGALFPANLVGNVIAGAVAEAGAQQSGDLMQDLKTGYLLGVPLPAQFTGQCLGSLVSVFASVAAFKIMDGAYGVPSKTLGAPTAALWVAMAELMSGSGLPSPVIGLMCAGGLLSLWVTLVTATWGEDSSSSSSNRGAPRKFSLQNLAPYLPSPAAFSVGMYVTANWTLPRLAGAMLASWLVEKKGLPMQTVILIATGLVLGEGVTALLTAVMSTAGARPISCLGCAPGLCGNFCD